MHGNSYIKSKQEQKLRNDAFAKHQFQVATVMNQDREVKLAKEYSTQNSTHWKVSNSKQRSFIHNRAEREVQIERDNLKLLNKLEEVKRKHGIRGQRSPEVKYLKNCIDLSMEQNRARRERRNNHQRLLSDQNLRISKKIQHAPASISNRQLIQEYQQNKKYLQIQEKTEGGRRDIVKGGFNTSPRGSSRLSKNFKDSMKLPPLSYKPIFKDPQTTTSTGWMQISKQLSSDFKTQPSATFTSEQKSRDLEVEELNDTNRNMIDDLDGSLLDQSILAKSSVRTSLQNRTFMHEPILKSSRLNSTGPSEFGTHFQKARAEDETVVRAIRQSEWLQQLTSQSPKAEAGPAVLASPSPFTARISQASHRTSEARGHLVSSSRSGVSKKSSVRRSPDNQVVNVMEAGQHKIRETENGIITGGYSGSERNLKGKSISSNQDANSQPRNNADLDVNGSERNLTENIEAYGTATKNNEAEPAAPVFMTTENNQANGSIQESVGNSQQ